MSIEEQMKANDLENKLAHISSELRDCRNELCLLCGQYKKKHLGACDGCRWKEGVWDER